MTAARIALSGARLTETPNASMITLASPTQGGTKTLSLWRVTMRPGQRGPQHTFDVEQAWHLLDGTATIAVDAESIDLTSGDTVVLPAGIPRQVGTDSGAVFVVTGLASGSATPISPDGPGEPVSPAWIA
ncbi:cupin domain-containing protein [Jiangella gansuensis]|uniref:cupin domain-containing protein n=1 Tax=Jiangella gansuensis TaxID=281473 RepID=UPI00047C7D25|nr:cupin domain-containing protein [Jiangella gansuensis]